MTPVPFISIGNSFRLIFAQTVSLCILHQGFAQNGIAPHGCGQQLESIHDPRDLFLFCAKPLHREPLAPMTGKVFFGNLICEFASVVVCEVPATRFRSALRRVACDGVLVGRECATIAARS